jgi:hypothetical protein
VERTEDELDLEFAMVVSMVIVDVDEAVDSTSGFVENCTN